jgi:uncharacterized protein (TIGR02996 family)
MNDEEALLRAVLERPDEEGTRAIFGDWLEEQGQGGGIVAVANTYGPSETHYYRFVYGPALVAVCTRFRAAHQVSTTFQRCYSLSRFATEAEDPSVEAWRTLGARRCLSIDNWAKVKALALAAPDCGEHRWGDASYHHSFWDRDTAIEATWHGPNSREHPSQAVLIAAYHSLIALAELLPSQIGRSQAP